jgi:ABC-2 type transport system permease protein
MTVIEQPSNYVGFVQPSAPHRTRRLVSAERARIRSTNGFVILAGAAASLAGVGSLGIGLTLGKPGGIDPQTSDGVRRAMSSGFTAGLVASLLGAILVTSEFRYRTCGQSVIDCGSRRTWYLTKLPIVVWRGVALTAIGQFTAVAVALPFLAREGIHPNLWGGPLLRMSIGTIALGIPSALWGAAIGLLLRSQVATVAGLILYTMAAEAAVVQFAPSIGRWLPGGAMAAIVADPTLPYHNTVGGVLVFSMWVVLATALGLSRLRRTDIPG